MIVHRARTLAEHWRGNGREPRALTPALQESNSTQFPRRRFRVARALANPHELTAGTELSQRRVRIFLDARRQVLRTPRLCRPRNAIQLTDRRDRRIVSAQASTRRHVLPPLHERRKGL